ncbi:MAG: sigma 54-interacting transcriptional regulator [Pseudomonadota bacterium]|nr:sigma 54-interacting transcriptional regulator [Pseudomonadota bacterium]
MSSKILSEASGPDIVSNYSVDITVLHEAARCVGSATDSKESVNKMLRLMSEMLGLNRGRVLLKDDTTGGLVIKYSYGLTEDQVARGRYKSGEGITGRVMDTRQVAVIQNVDEERNFLFKAVDREILPDGVVSYLAVPIFNDQDCIGVLAAHRLRMRPRSIQSDLLILRVIATLIAQVVIIEALVFEKTSRLERENDQLRQALKIKQPANIGILGDSASLKQALAKTLQVSDQSVTVLLTGESGTGKERFAQILHLNGRRRDKPFVAINCAAIPENLLESELFGYEKGAFTGANATKKGKFEYADGGTVFLDEIGDLTFELQAKLLRVLETTEVYKIGSTTPIPVDVRIVAATHKDLQLAVNDGRFRLDLYYRLSVFPIHLPPLRDRGNDIGLLARHFLLVANTEYGKNLYCDSSILQQLEGYDWPGNIRQLENVIRRLVLSSIGSEISKDSVSKVLEEESAIESYSKTSAQASSQRDRRTETPERLTFNAANSGEPKARPYGWVTANERMAIEDALQVSFGNKTQAARALGMSLRQLRYRIQKLKINQTIYSK